MVLRIRYESHRHFVQDILKLFCAFSSPVTANVATNIEIINKYLVKHSSNSYTLLFHRIREMIND